MSPRLWNFSVKYSRTWIHEILKVNFPKSGFGCCTVWWSHIKLWLLQLLLMINIVNFHFISIIVSNTVTCYVWSLAITMINRLICMIFTTASSRNCSRLTLIGDASWSPMQKVQERIGKNMIWLVKRRRTELWRQDLKSIVFRIVL